MEGEQAAEEEMNLVERAGESDQQQPCGWRRNQRNREGLRFFKWFFKDALQCSPHPYRLLF